MITVGGTGSGISETAYLLVLGGHQHIQETVDIGLVGGYGIFDGARHGAQGGLVKDVVRALYGFAAVIQIADVALDEAEAGPLFFGDQSLDLIQVVLVAGGEVVQAHYCLVQLEQGFQQIGAYETGNAGDEPGFGVGLEVGFYFFVAGHFGPGCWWLLASRARPAPTNSLPQRELVPYI